MNDPKETKPPMEDRWDYDHGSDHIREVMEDQEPNRPQDGRICNCEDAPCCGCYSSGWWNDTD